MSENETTTQDPVTEETLDPSTSEQQPEVTDQQAQESELPPISKINIDIQALQSKISTHEEVIKSEKEKALRAYAELENFKKRKEQEKEDFCRFSNEKFIRELLPVLDSFDYAVDHAQNEQSNESQNKLLEGFVLIQKQFHAFLEKIGVSSFESVNTKFDPNFHQAVLQEEKEGFEAGLVLKEMQRGYKYNERILRPAMVVVSK